MQAISLPLDILEQSFRGILSAIRSDELSRKELIAYVEEVEKTLLDKAETEKYLAVSEALNDVTTANVERLSTNARFDMPEQNFHSLLEQALSDVAEGRISRYGK